MSSAILISLEVVAKIAFRFGLDGSFMRFFYDHEQLNDRRQLASTIFFFLLALNGAVLTVLLIWAPAIGAALFGSRAYTTALRLMLINTFVIGFTFIPFHVLRMEKRTVTFSLFTLARAASTTLARIVLVMVLRLGVTGLYIADILVTTLIMAGLARWFAPLIRPMFSAQVLRETLAFGLPRVPHAAAQQVLAVGDRFIMTMYSTMEYVGIYSMGVSFGLTQKLFLSAFESAWAPFYYGTIREPDAPRVFSTISTYGVAILALLTAGLAAAGSEALAAMTHGRLLAPDDPRWPQVAAVITWTSIGVLLQGVYLLSSIGLNITKRTQYYPVATIAAAGTNVLLNFLWIPRFGIVGAAWANGAGYAVQAALGFVFSQRFYPIAYEWGRLARVIIAALSGYAVARMVPSIRIAAINARSSMAPVPDVLARGMTVVAVFAAVLAISGFFRTDELRRLRALRRSAAPVRTSVSADNLEGAGEIVVADISVPE